MPRRAGTNARRLLSASLLALFAVVSADEASPASALDTLDWEDRGDAPVPDLPPRRASFPLRASPGDAPGEVRLAWTPPRTSRVFPGLGADDGKNENATDAVNLERFRARFEDASSLAAESRAYDVLVGACLNNAPTTTLNLYPYAPLPCASVVRERTSLGDEKKRNDERDKTSDVFFRRDASPRGVKGTSFVVTGLTPGAAYAFRVVTSDAPPDAEDADAVSGVAVVRARGEWLDYESAADVTETPSLRFCGAVKDAFPNGTALLFSEEKRGASACCLACAETVGCNAWAHRSAAGAAEDGSCWLMYAPPAAPSKTKKNAEASDDASEEVDVLLKTPGWVGGVLDPSSADPPLVPSGVQLVDVSEQNARVDFDASAFAFDVYFPQESIERLRKVCVAWDPAPALPAPLAAERSAVQRYVIRTTSEFAKKSEDASDDDDDDEDDGEDWSSFATLEAERDADLPPLFCACDGWRVPEPTRRRVDRSNDDSDAPLSSEEDDVTITTRVVAENDAGRSSPASFTVTVPLLVARALAAATAETDAESDEDSGTTASSSCPSSSPRSMLAPPLGLRATRLADDAVFVDWSPPPFEVFAGEAEENESDLEEALSPIRLGYQVVWRAWDDTSLSLLVAPPRAVTLADEEALERLAAPPCGEGEDEDASSEEPASCFSAPLATSLRLEGVPDADALLVGVRALTPSGPGPLSEPVVVRAEERGGRDAVGTDGVSDDDAAAESDADAESDSFEPAAKADTEATLPAAPALTPPPLYESERVGAVYEQINRPQSQSTATNGGGGVNAYDEETTTTEEFQSSSQAPFAGVGAFDGYGGYPGFGYPFGMGALGLGGLGGYGFRDRPAYYDSGFPYGEGNGTGGSVSVTTGATLVTLNVNLNGNGTVRESAARGDPTGSPSPSPPPPPPSSPRPPPSVTSSPSPSPPPPASIGGLAAQQQKESAPRGASSRDPEAVDRIDDEEDAATVRVGGAVSSDERDSDTADDSDDSDASSRRAAVVRLDDEEDAEEDSAGESPNPLASTRLNENPPVKRLDRDASDKIVLDDSAARRRTEAPLEDDASDASTSARREIDDSSSLGRRGGPADARENERSEEEAKKRRVPTNRSSERAKRASALAATKRAEKASSTRISAKNAAAAGRAATSRGAGDRQ
jgi:hypothetical protein